MVNDKAERTRTVLLHEGLHFGGYQALIVSRVNFGFVEPVVDPAEFMMGFVASTAECLCCGVVGSMMG